MHGLVEAKTAMQIQRHEREHVDCMTPLTGHLRIGICTASVRHVRRTVSVVASRIEKHRRSVGRLLPKSQLTITGGVRDAGDRVEGLRRERRFTIFCSRRVSLERSELLRRRPAIAGSTRQRRCIRLCGATSVSRRTGRRRRSFGSGLGYDRRRFERERRGRSCRRRATTAHSRGWLRRSGRRRRFRLHGDEGKQRRVR